MKTRFPQQQIWQHHIEQWQASGSTQAGYCRQHQLKLHQFVYWRSKLSVNRDPVGTLPAKQSSANFVPVVIEPSAQAELTIHLPNGIRIEGINAITIPLTQQLIGALK